MKKKHQDILDKVTKFMDSPEGIAYFENLKWKKEVSKYQFERVERWLHGRKITQEIEDKFVKWFTKYEDYRYDKHQEISTSNLFGVFRKYVQKYGKPVEDGYKWKSYDVEVLCGQGYCPWHIYKKGKQIFQNS